MKDMEKDDDVDTREDWKDLGTGGLVNNNSQIYKNNNTNVWRLQWERLPIALVGFSRVDLLRRALDPVGNGDVARVLQ